MMSGNERIVSEYERIMSELSPNEKLIVEYLMKNEKIVNKEASSLTGLSPAQVRRVFVRIKTETGGVILDKKDAAGLKKADRNHILGFGQCCTHAHRAFIFPVVILGSPGLAAGHRCGKTDWLIQNNRRWGEPFFQRT